MKILAFGASYSSTSINKTFAEYATGFFPAAEIEILDLRSFPLPLFTTDLEKEIGKPQAAIEFVEKLATADLLIISLAEHNGSYTTAFKNLFDWASRLKVKMFENKKMLLLSAAPGPRGGISALQSAITRFPIHGAEVLGSFSLPKFGDNFAFGEGITDESLKVEFMQVIDNAKQLLA
ncbi:NADPH-dependent FMN reductase [Pedobacter xixiisoli]|uniref:NAD(P)H-dependent FMN reductase n=1 Tax=Pedobacter xixiisoli TaxID=1476464 RepID=A0A285ZPC4_9SPHI|nr:NAD(P)H-dependent oxidoreductase [Pedobacter xixiisoli]SOD11469.1 NAD(P)H-dependent FMN reductase [Pedobacter xixiisoli]